VGSYKYRNMSTQRNELENKLIDVMLERGVERINKLQQIRDYINTSPHDNIIDQLSQVTSNKLLVQLQAVGVPAWLSTTFFTVWNQNAKRSE
jgi:hypothetical protein